MRHELILKPGEQITLGPGMKHWFQAADKGGVMYSFSSVAHDVLDGFTNPDIKRVTEIK
jgi:D-lyxose ketol-isomerase